MAHDPTGKRVAILVAPEGTEHVELAEPKAAVEAAGSVRGFFEKGKPVAAIRHGPWVLVGANVVRGRTLTSYPSLQTDIRNAGARGAVVTLRSARSRPTPAAAVTARTSVRRPAA